MGTRWVSQLRSSILTIFRGQKLDRDLDRELRATFELLVEEKREAGVSEIDARRQAGIELGGLEKLKEDVRAARIGSGLAGTLEEVRLAFRFLRRRRAYSMVATVTLSLGVAANTAILVLVQTVLLRPLPYGPSSGLVRLTSENQTRGWTSMPLPDAAFIDLADRSRSLQAMGAYVVDELTLIGGEEPLRVSSARVTPDLLTLMELRPQLGRILATDQEARSRQSEVLLSQRLWLRAFGGRSDILGQRIELDQNLHRVVGVAPSSFQFPSAATDLWTELLLPPGGGTFDKWYLQVVAQLRPGQSLEASQSEIDQIGESFGSRLPFGQDWRFRLAPLTDGLVAEARPRLLALLGAVGLVLLLVCANLANLTLAEASARRRELGLRSALGAGTLHLLRQALIESLVVSVLAGLVGVLLLRAGFDAFLLALPAEFPRSSEVRFDGSALLIGVGLSLASGLLAGLLPALQAARLAPQQALKPGGAGETGGSRPGPRQALVVAEVAFAFVLVVGAALLQRSLQELLDVEPGFEPKDVLALSISLPEPTYQEPELIVQFVEALTTAAREMPAIRSLGVTTGLPTKGVGALDGSLKILRRSGVPEEHQQNVAIDSITPGYLRAMGIPLLRGRPFAKRDGPGAPRVALINATIAKRFFVGEDPVGQELLAPNDEDRWTVVGVVGDVKQYGLDEETPLQVYVPFAQQPTRSFRLTAASDRTTAQLTAIVTSLVRRLDPSLPVYDILEMEQALTSSIADQRLHSRLMLGFGLLALLVAASGIFSVISYAVSRRRHELGLRMALGAGRSQILGLVLRQGLKNILGGLLVGLVACWMLAPVFKSLLYGVAGYDPPTFLFSALLLVAVGLTALAIPAQRAARRDALGCLRYD